MSQRSTNPSTQHLTKGRIKAAGNTKVGMQNFVYHCNHPKRIGKAKEIAVIQTGFIELHLLMIWNFLYWMTRVQLMCCIGRIKLQLAVLALLRKIATFSDILVLCSVMDQRVQHVPVQECWAQEQPRNQPEQILTFQHKSSTLRFVFLTINLGSVRSWIFFLPKDYNQYAYLLHA